MVWQPEDDDVGKRGWWVLFLLLVLFLAVLIRPAPLGEDAAGSTVREPLSFRAPFTVLQERRLVRRFRPGLAVDGLPVGGWTTEQTAAALEIHRLRPLHEPLLLLLDGRPLFLNPTDFDLQISLETTIAAAHRYTELWPFEGWTIYLSPYASWVAEPLRLDLPLEVTYDRSAVQAFLESVAQTYDRPPMPLSVRPLTATLPFTPAGTATWPGAEPLVSFQRPGPGRELDVDQALALIDEQLLGYDRRPIDLPRNTLAPPAFDLSLLEEILRAQVAEMPGVVGVYLYDLQGRGAAGVNEEVLFSGASVPKIGIMLQVYRHFDEPLPADLLNDLRAMMIYSDNGAANRLLALTGGGNALQGAAALTEMLQRLGLRHTAIRRLYYAPPPPSEEEPPPQEPPPADPQPPPPTEAPDPAPSGGIRPAPFRAQEPVTDADPYLHTTPREMGLLLSYIYAGARGEGPLLALFPGEITADECQAMLALMVENSDRQRIVAGVPVGTPVAHKSGWIRDMRADAGIVASPGGDYVLSIFVWQETETWLPAAEINARIASLAWTTYAYYNPIQRVRDPAGVSIEPGSPID